MICEKCKTEHPYMADYCMNCGEKVSPETLDAEYKKTGWAKLDKVKDIYDTLFLKKITDNVIFKIVSFVLVVAWFFFTMHGRLFGIRLKDSEDYRIQYYKEAQEYYIRPTNESSVLDLFAPLGTDNLLFRAYSGNEEQNVQSFTHQEYKEQGYVITAGEYDYIVIEAVNNEKIADSIKIIVRN